VVGDDEAVAPRNGGLAFFDFVVAELFDVAAIEAHQMVVVLFLAQFIDRLADFEVVAREDACLLELGEHAVNGGQADIGAVGQQQAIYVFCREVAAFGSLEDFQNLQSGAGGLEAGDFEFVGGAHADKDARAACGGQECKWTMKAMRRMPISLAFTTFDVIVHEMV